MNEQLQKALADAIGKGTEGATIVATKLWEQFPDLCNQIVAYGIAINTCAIVATLAFSILLVVVVFVVAAYIYIHESRKDNGEVALCLPPFLFLFGLMFPAFILCTSVDDLIKCKTAPKLYILEQVQRFIK